MPGASFLQHRWLPCLLAFCLVGAGPAALASMPRTAFQNAEEETRSHSSPTECVISSAVRMSRAAGRRDHPTQPSRQMSAASRSSQTDPAAKTLRALQVRIQV